MDISDVRKKSVEEVHTMLKDNRRSLFEYILNLRQGKETDVASIRGMRKDIARLMTIIREKEILDNA